MQNTIKRQTFAHANLNIYFRLKKKKKNDSFNCDNKAVVRNKQHSGSNSTNLQPETSTTEDTESKNSKNRFTQMKCR